MTQEQVLMQYIIGATGIIIVTLLYIAWGIYKIKKSTNNHRNLGYDKN